MVLSASVVPFVHPSLAALAVAAGLIPVLIHLLNRRRFRRVPWAAMSLLLAANRRSTRRMRLEHWLLMLARIGVMLLLGLAIARPYVPATALIPSTTSRVHRVVVIDNSLSMSARGSDGRTGFAAAQDCASHLVGSFPPSDAVSLVTMAAPAHAVIAHEAFDRRFVRESLLTIEPTHRATDPLVALSMAADIVRESHAALGNRIVYVLSDFARREWESASTEIPSEAVRAARQLADALTDPSVDLNFVVVDVGRRENVAVTRLEPESPLVGLNVPTRIVTEVTNFASTPARNVSLQVRRDGLIVRREQLARLEPGASAVSIVTTELTSEGTHAIEARITAPGDALETDDARYYSVEVREQRPLLLVDGRPGLRLLEGQAGFLATALAPDGHAVTDDRTSASAGRTRPVNLFAPKVVSEPEFDAELLTEYDAVALCNVARISPTQWTRLQRFVSAGGGLLVVLGDLVSADQYNRLGLAEGVGLLPAKIGRAGQPGAHPHDTLGFKLDGGTHPVVAEFAGHPSGGFFLARVERYLSVEPDLRRAEVVLRYTNDEPALVASTFGKGRVLLWTTSANLDWNNLPAKGDFVALMHNMAGFLVPRRGEHRNIVVGQTLLEPLTPAESASTLRVSADDGSSFEPSLAAHEDGLAMSVGPMDRAQFLTLNIGSKGRLAAVNVDPAESDLSSMEVNRLATVIDRPARILTDRAVREAQPAAAKSTELASVVLYIVLALLLGEMWMGMRFGSGQDEATERQAAA